MKKITILIILLFLSFSLNFNLCTAKNLEFKDISTYKRGSLIIYSIYTNTKSFEKMQAYAKKKPDIGGSKIVYFFDNLKNTPNISKIGMEFDNHFNKYWIGGYFKYANGKEKFLEYPGRK